MSAMRPLPFWPHQAAAVSCTEKVLATGDRAQLHLACGTGKTRIGEGIALSSQAHRIALFFPSLALIGQTLAVWRADGATASREVLCVCSDKTVANADDLELTAEDIGCAVTTDASEIRKADSPVYAGIAP